MELRDEPPKSGRYSEINDALDQLRATPGRWGLVMMRPGSVSGTVGRITHGEYRSCEPGEFECTTRRQPDGQVALWACYVGNGKAKTTKERRPSA
jgi:hypothetical protein